VPPPGIVIDVQPELGGVEGPFIDNKNIDPFMDIKDIILYPLNELLDIDP
jgi:hypothetical protein